MNTCTPLPIKKTPVILTVIFDLLTFGIYSCAWFLVRRDGFNQVSRFKKIGIAIPVICLIAYVLSLMPGGNAFETVAGIGGGLLLLFPSFRAKSILEQYLKDQDYFDRTLSDMATFFFRIYYLQYRINKIHEATSNQRFHSIATPSGDQVDAQAAQSDA